MKWYNILTISSYASVIRITLVGPSVVIRTTKAPEPGLNLCLHKQFSAGSLVKLCLRSGAITAAQPRITKFEKIENHKTTNVRQKHYKKSSPNIIDMQRNNHIKGNKNKQKYSKKQRK